MKLDYLCYLGYLDCCPNLYCYIHNVSADVSSGLLLVLLVELGNFLFLFAASVYMMVSRVVSLTTFFV